MSANPNYTYLQQQVKTDRVINLRGGTRSGKSYSIIYFIIDLCVKYKGLEIDIVRDTFTALNATAWFDFKKVLISHGIYKEYFHNKSEKTYWLYGNLISYYGADNEEKIHGRSRDILWLNEANYISKDVVDQIYPRTRFRIINDYNPALPDGHWLEDYERDFGYLKTTYKDNIEYLTDGQISEIERRMTNPYWWKVYGLGEKAVPEGVIITNWERGSFDLSLPYINAMDFGFTNDPTTHGKVAVDDKRKIIYVKENFFGQGLSTGQIIDLMRPYKDVLTVADSAEPRLIEEIRRAGIPIEACEKGPDSVRSGLNAMIDYLIIVDDSPNIEKELNLYKWNDKKSGIPVDANNHRVDWMRYGFTKLRYTLDARTKW